ncbi:EscU/YscU/HrcU family type III secretion system export apparatus switch protein [Pelagibius sp.]|uniref:EscU/YscU/HrcU family type III secretion system export apparatus switch protein n=1 Tax=Pelagibius sp. TaxID=1931238 RepID=UPI00260A8B04|nr:EscU/YscU/HrcU family type III secretion system export apparatus switch protein [Pelagibius sp.]
MTQNRPLEQSKARRGTSTAGTSSAEPAGLAIALENVNAGALDRMGSAAARGCTPGGAPGGAPGGTPRVTASGRGAVAEQILQIAFERGIKVRKDSDLAEILSVVEVESEIPLAALAGVAEILRYLYQTDSDEQSDSNNQSDTGAGATPTAEENRQ